MPLAATKILGDGFNPSPDNEGSGKLDIFDGWAGNWADGWEEGSWATVLSRPQKRFSLYQLSGPCPKLELRERNLGRWRPLSQVNHW